MLINLGIGLTAMLGLSSTETSNPLTYLELNKAQTEQVISSTFPKTSVSYNYPTEGHFEFAVSLASVNIYDSKLSNGDIDITVKLESLTDDFMLDNEVILTYSSIPHVSSKDNYLGFNLEKLKDINYHNIPDFVRNQVNALMQDKVIPLIEMKLKTTPIEDLDDSIVFKLKHDLQYVEFDVENNAIFLNIKKIKQ